VSRRRAPLGACIWAGCSEPCRPGDGRLCAEHRAVERAYERDDAGVVDYGDLGFVPHGVVALADWRALRGLDDPEGVR
jgi:hypothetical protein